MLPVEQIFAVNSGFSHPQTPTLPVLQDQPTSLRFRSKPLKIITAELNSMASPVVKTTAERKKLSQEYARRSLFSGDPVCGTKNEMAGSPKKSSLRSMSTSNNDKGRYYLHEINSLNNKIKRLIKEQETLRDIVQESTGREAFRNVYSEVQSATIPESGSIDESYFNVTFRPQEKWLPRSRKFPRDVFSRPIKNK